MPNSESTATNTRATFRFSSWLARRRNQSSRSGCPQENSARSWCLPSGSISIPKPALPHHSTMTLQGGDQLLIGLGRSHHGSEESLPIRTDEEHALMVIENPLGAFIG